MHNACFKIRDMNTKQLSLPRDIILHKNDIF